MGMLIVDINVVCHHTYYNGNIKGRPEASLSGSCLREASCAFFTLMSIKQVVFNFDFDCIGGCMGGFKMSDMDEASIIYVILIALVKVDVV